VKVSDLGNRIDGLEENLKTIRVKGTTKIDWSCFTFEEQTLFEHIRELKDK